MGEAADSVDGAEVLARFGGDRELLKAVVAVLRSQIPTALGTLRSAAAAGDAEAMHRAAHKLKGSVGVFGPSGAADAVARLDAAATAGDLAAAGRDVEALETLFARLVAQLERVLA